MTKQKNLMAATWTKAAKVRRAFKAGRQRQKDLDYTCDRAIHEAFILLIEIRKEMLRAGIRTADEDLRAALVLFSESHGIEILPMPTHVDGLPEFSSIVLKTEKARHARPLGVAVELRDREAQDKSVWIQSWLADPDVLEASQDAAEIFFEDWS